MWHNNNFIISYKMLNKFCSSQALCRVWLTIFHISLHIIFPEFDRARPSEPERFGVVTSPQCISSSCLPRWTWFRILWFEIILSGCHAQASRTQVYALSFPVFNQVDVTRRWMVVLFRFPPFKAVIVIIIVMSNASKILNQQFMF